MNHFAIDINADVGEGIGNEEQLMPYISSCNIACGGHAGDFSTMEHVVILAKKNGVKIGAHPSFPDRNNFGREVISISENLLFSSLSNQINELMKVILKYDVSLNHIKPHGALYNLAAINKVTAAVIIRVMKSLPPNVKLYVPYKSVIADLAIESNIPIVYEAFADRNYNDDLSLVSRKEDDALIHNPEVMFQHVYRMVSTQKVKTIHGNDIEMNAQTFCVHGDNPKAISLIKHLRSKLKDGGIDVL